MRAQRDESPLHEEQREQRGTYLIIGIAAVVIIALLLYFALRDPAETETAAPQQVIRDTVSLIPPVVNTAETPAAAPEAAADTGDFARRQLSPPSPTVGAGEAPVANPGEAGEALVIDGELLEELEEDAAVASPEN